MRYNYVPKGGVSTTATVKFTLCPMDFLELVKGHKLEDIYLIQADDPFILENEIVMTSKCRYLFAATYDNVFCLLDSMGYTTLEDLEESIENGTFYLIDDLKQKNSSEYWDNDTGTIYRRLKEEGYETETQIKSAYRFLEGDISLSLEAFLKCENKAKKGGFRTLRELCISKSAGFNDRNDYEDARNLGASDMHTLEAYRLVNEIMYKFDFESLSESLLMGIVVYLVSKELESREDEAFIDLGKIDYLYRYWQPERSNADFNKFKTMEEVENFLQGSRGRLLGHYSLTNRQLHFSPARIYIDGSNVAFKGTKKGEKNEGLETPDLQILKNCHDQLQNESFGPVKIILDGLVAKKILKKDTPSNKKFFDELRFDGKLETTITGEYADDTLIQKMRDDPHAYVVVNDDYAKDHHITDRDLGHIINVRFKKDALEFYGEGYENLKRWKSLLNELKSEALSLYNLKKLGNWPYTDGWFESTYYLGDCCD